MEQTCSDEPYLEQHSAPSDTSQDEGASSSEPHPAQRGHDLPRQRPLSERGRYPLSRKLDFDVSRTSLRACCVYDSLR